MNDGHRRIVNVSKEHLQQALVPAMEPLLKTMGLLYPSEVLESINIIDDLGILSLELDLNKEVKTYNINGKEQS